MNVMKVIVFYTFVLCVIFLSILIYHWDDEISSRHYAFLINELNLCKNGIALEAAKEYFQDGKITRSECIKLGRKFEEDKQNYQKKILREILDKK